MNIMYHQWFYRLVEVEIFTEAEVEMAKQKIEKVFYLSLSE
jgi:hypothetical protein